MEIVSTQQPQRRIHPHKFTLWVAMASIIMMFAGLTSAYIVKRSAANWEEVQTPQLFIYSTLVLLASSLAVQLGLRAFKQRNMRQYRMLLSATVVLGIAFVVLQWFGFNGCGHTACSLKALRKGSSSTSLLGCTHCT
jgi:cytochrome c oxidase subunit 3